MSIHQVAPYHHCPQMLPNKSFTLKTWWIWYYSDTTQPRVGNRILVMLDMMECGLCSTCSVNIKFTCDLSVTRWRENCFIVINWLHTKPIPMWWNDWKIVIFLRINLFRDFNWWAFCFFVCFKSLIQKKRIMSMWIKGQQCSLIKLSIWSEYRGGVDLILQLLFKLSLWCCFVSWTYEACFPAG